MALEKAKKIVAFNPVTVFWFLFRSFSYEYFCFLRIFPDYKRVDVFVFFTARVIVHYAVQVKRLFHYAVQVKRLLTKLGVNFKAIELDTESDGREIQAALAQFTGQRTVPNVFIGGKHIGGCDDTMALNSSGRLVPLLAEAGAIAKVAA